MELQKIKDVLLGRTLIVRDTETNAEYIYEVSDVESTYEVSEDGCKSNGYVVYGNKNSAGCFLKEEALELLCLYGKCTDGEYYEFTLKQTQIGCSNKRTIDWEERTWQLLSNLVAVNNVPSGYYAETVENLIKIAHDAVEKYKKSMEEESHE